MFQRTRKAVSKILEWLLIVLMAANVINVLWQVFTRFILRNPSPFTEELARFLLIWVGLLGASYAAGQKMHLAIDVILVKLRRRARCLAELLIHFFVFLFALLVMVIGGTRLVVITLMLHQISAALRVKLGYVYLVLPLSGLLIIFFSSASFWETAYSLRKKSAGVFEEYLKKGETAGI